MIDKESKEYEEVYNKAIKYFASGADEKYIKFQFAEQGVKDELADEVLKEIRLVSGGVRKRFGMKLMIYGSSFIAAGLLMTYLVSGSDSPVKAVVWGLPVMGAVLTFAGIKKIIGQ